MQSSWKKWFSPASVTLVAVLLFLSIWVAGRDGDIMSLATVGTQYSQGDSEGTEGYDGQFVYFIAREWTPGVVDSYLDVPAYRYQRILLPALARLFSLGSPDLIPWLLPVINIAGHVLGVWAVSKLLEDYGVSRWYALVYGFWVGFMLSLRLDLPEPLAVGLAAAAMLASVRGRKGLSWLLYAMALFAKEVMILFIAAQMLYDLLKRRWRDVVGLGLISLVPFALFQVWLYQVFGQFGIASGGNYSTPFEVIPFMGMFRMGYYSFWFMAGVLVIYIPFIIVPTIWSFVRVFQRWRGEGVDLIGVALLVNALILLFIPFSTYREPNGTFRFIGGFVMLVVLFAAKFNYKKALNYSLLWLVLDTFLLRI